MPPPLFALLFRDLPEEILLAVFMLCPNSSVLRLSRVCKRFGSVLATRATSLLVFREQQARSRDGPVLDNPRQHFHISNEFARDFPAAMSSWALRHVTSLRLTGRPLWERPFEEAEEADHFQVEVDMNEVDVFEKGLAKAHALLPHLSTLTVESICDPGVDAFADAIASGAFGDLTELTLGQNWFGDAGMKTLTAAITAANGSGLLGQLTTLWLYGNRIGDGGVEAFASAVAGGALPNLTVLGLNSNEIGDAGASAIASSCASGALGQLTQLELDGNRIGDGGMQAFASAVANGALGNLVELDLMSNQIGDEGMKAFSAAIDSGALPALEKVYLGGNPGNRAPVDKALADRKKSASTDASES